MNLTKEMKYGILALVALLIAVPAVFLLIKLGVLFLGAIFNHPVTILCSSAAFLFGMFMNEKCR